MKIEPFELERFFDRWEFEVDRQISASDCESMTIEELLGYNEMHGKSTESKINSLDRVSLGYTESRGDPALRDGIAQLYKEVSAEGIIVAAPEEAIFLFLNSLLDKGDHVVIMSPVYQSLVSVPRSLGASIDRWWVEYDRGSGRWSIDFDALEELVGKKTKMLVVNIPHNPTGFCMTSMEKRRLVEIAERYNVVLFADEMYQRLEYDPEADAIPLCDMYDRAVSLSGLSKAYGLPGLRIGWLAAQRKKLIDEAAALKDYTTICNSAPSEYLARIAVSASNELVGRSLSTVKRNLRLLEEFVVRNSDRIELPPGMGGSVVFPAFRDGTSASDFSEALLERENLLLLPGTMFAMPERFFRVGLGRVDLNEGLSVVECVLKDFL